MFNHPTNCPEVDSHDAIVETSEVRKLLSRAEDHRLALTRPRHSLFRVVALIEFEPSELYNPNLENEKDITAAVCKKFKNDKDENSNPKTKYLLGSNFESVGLSFCICAEKTALSRLRIVDRNAKILRIGIVTDALSTCIMPGASCRELIIQNFNVLKDNVPIIMGCDYDTEKKIHTTVKVVGARELWPMPNIYRNLDRTDAVKCGEIVEKIVNSELGSKMISDASDRKQFRSPSEESVFSATTSASSKKTTTPTRSVKNKNPVSFEEFYCELRKKSQYFYKKFSKQTNGNPPFPIFYTAGVLFSDGTMKFAKEDQGMEYPTTFDAMAKLIAHIDEKLESGGKNDADKTAENLVIDANTQIEQDPKISSVLKNLVKMICCGSGESSSQNSSTERKVPCSSSTSNNIPERLSDVSGSPVAKIVRSKTGKLNEIEFVQSRKSKVQPEIILLIDQHGILHAPFSGSRAYFYEYGFSDVITFVHKVDFSEDFKYPSMGNPSMEREFIENFGSTSEKKRISESNSEEDSMVKRVVLSEAIAMKDLYSGGKCVIDWEDLGI